MTSTDPTLPSPKFDLPELSFILHYRKDSEDREYNLGIILKFLSDHFTSEIIVVIDDIEKHFYTDTLNWISKYADVKLFPNSDQFKKSECFNGGASFANGSVLCFWDVDVMIEPRFIKEAYNMIISGESDHVYPFNGTFIDVQKALFPWLEYYHFDQMLGLWDEKDIDLHFASGESPGGCNMISRKAFEKIGGYDEGFIGWGFEDTDFLNRSVCRNTVNKINKPDAICWHLHHDQAIRTENPHYHNNIIRFNQNRFKDATLYAK